MTTAAICSRLLVFLTLGPATDPRDGTTPLSVHGRPQVSLLLAHVDHASAGLDLRTDSGEDECSASGQCNVTCDQLDNALPE